MSIHKEVLSGTCRTCGSDLVQVVGQRTYHPALTSDPSKPCPALLPIADTSYFSFDVPDDEFVAGLATAERP